MTKQDIIDRTFSPNSWMTKGQFSDHLTALIKEECATRDNLMEAYVQYINLLGEELDEVTTMLSVHGWKSKRVEAGLTCRDRISNLKAKI